MLIDMQWAYARGKCQEELPYDRLNLVENALTMNNGQVRSLGTPLWTFRITHQSPLSFPQMSCLL